MVNGTEPVTFPPGRLKLLTNPAFTERKLKLRTFQSNLDYGCFMWISKGGSPRWSDCRHSRARAIMLPMMHLQCSGEAACPGLRSRTCYRKEALGFLTFFIKTSHCT